MVQLSPAASSRLSESSAAVLLMPVVLAIFLGFQAVNLPLAAVALDARDRLGFSSAAVGWVIGLQSLATLVTRHRAGTLCDRRGHRVAVVLGLPLAAVAGLIYVRAARLPIPPSDSLALLILPGARSS